MLARARSMRHCATDAERALWRLLRARQFVGHKFRRQQPIGRYIADFVCFETRLIVEADGGQHADRAYDAVRDDWLRSQGFLVLRLSNNDILANPDGVAAEIVHALATPHPPVAARRAPPSPARGEGIDGAFPDA